MFETAIPAVGFDVSLDGWFVFRTAAMQEDVYVMHADGSGLRKLTDDEAKDRNPVWSPDGSQAAFYSNRSGRYEIWTVNRAARSAGRHGVHLETVNDKAPARLGRHDHRDRHLLAHRRERPEQPPLLVWPAQPKPLVPQVQLVKLQRQPRSLVHGHELARSPIWS